MDTMIFIGNLGFGELVIIFFIILLLFGSSKLPGVAKSIGESIKEFKKSIEAKDKKDTEEKTE